VGAELVNLLTAVALDLMPHVYEISVWRVGRRTTVPA